MNVVGKIRSVRNVLAILLVAIYSFYYINATMFSHSHVINGVTLVHSHIQFPDRGSSSSDGGHSMQELALIANLNASLILTASVTAVFMIPVLILLQVFSASESGRTFNVFHKGSRLRAPPVCCA